MLVYYRLRSCTLLVLLSGLWANPALLWAQCFQNTLDGSTYYTQPVNRSANGLLLADINADGKPDMVSISRSESQLSVALNTGSGTFGPATTYTVTDPEAVVVADVNADGKPDVLIANSFAGKIYVLLNTGSGALGAVTEYDSFNPGFLTVGDVNADSKPDIIALYIGSSGYVSVLLNTGSGTFGAATNYTVGSYPIAVGISDVNRDGKPDLVVANSGSNTVSILPNDGSGTFGSSTTISVGYSPNSLVMVDINADGIPDLVTADANGITVLLHNGAAAFSSPSSYGSSQLTNVQVADVNGDTKPDVLAGDSQNKGLAVLLNTGSGVFATPNRYRLGYAPSRLAVGVVNPDALPDVIALHYMNVFPTVSVMLNTGSGAFGQIARYDTGEGPTAIAVADVNADGKPDLISANSIAFTNHISVLTNNSANGYGPAVNYSMNGGATHVSVVDVNADNKPDLISVSSFRSPGKVSIRLNSGTGTFGALQSVTTGNNPSLAVADLNADGKADIVTANRGDNTVSVFINGGTGTFGAATTLAVGSSPSKVVLADVNGDNRPDILTVNSVDGGGVFSISVLLNTGSGSFGAATNLSLVNPNYNLNYYAVFNLVVTDINGDLKPDLITEGSDYSNTNYILTLLNTGSGTFGTASPRSFYFPITAITAPDVDGDGYPDLAFGTGNGRVEVVLNDGTGSFGSPVEFLVNDRIRAITAADLNADGKPDLVVGNTYNTTTSYGDESVSVLLNCTSMQSQQVGNWNDLAIWSLGRLPTLADIVTINNVVTIPDGFMAQAKKVILGLNGKLVYVGSGQLKLAP